MLNGGEGKECCVGNAGADTFLFTTLSHSGNSQANADVIPDFQSVKDVINVSALDAMDNNAIANDAFVGIASLAVSGMAGQLRRYQSGGNTCVAMGSNGNSVADCVIKLSHLISLQAVDVRL